MPLVKRILIPTPINLINPGLTLLNRQRLLPLTIGMLPRTITIRPAITVTRLSTTIMVRPTTTGLGVRVTITAGPTTLSTVSGIGIVPAMLRVTVSTRISPVTTTLAGAVATMSRLRVSLVSTGLNVRIRVASSPLGPTTVPNIRGLGVRLGRVAATISIRTTSLSITLTAMALGSITVSLVPASLSITLTTTALGRVTIGLGPTRLGIASGTVSSIGVVLDRLSATVSIRTVAVGIMNAFRICGRVTIGLVSTGLRVMTGTVSALNAVLGRLTATIGVRTTGLSVTLLRGMTASFRRIAIGTASTGLSIRVGSGTAAARTLGAISVILGRLTVSVVRRISISAGHIIITSLASAFPTSLSLHRPIVRRASRFSSASTRSLICTHRWLSITGSFGRLSSFGTHGLVAPRTSAAGVISRYPFARMARTRRKVWNGRIPCIDPRCLTVTINLKARNIWIVHIEPRPRSSTNLDISVGSSPSSYGFSQVKVRKHTGKNRVRYLTKRLAQHRTKRVSHVEHHAGDFSSSPNLRQLRPRRPKLPSL